MSHDTIGGWQDGPSPDPSRMREGRETYSFDTNAA